MLGFMLNFFRAFVGLYNTFLGTQATVQNPVDFYPFMLGYHSLQNAYNSPKNLDPNSST